MSNSLKYSGVVKRLRRAKGWTISRAAKESGMTDEQWENLESGRHHPLAGNLYKAVQGMGFSMDTFDWEDFERVQQ